MGVDWTKLLDLKGRYFLVLWVLLAVVLIAPPQLAQTLGFNTFLGKYRYLVGVAFLGAFFVWLVKIIPWCLVWWKVRQDKKAVLGELKSLTAAEKFLLMYALDRKTRTIFLHIDDSIATSLINKGLLVRATGAADALYWPFLIRDFVWTHLMSNRDSILEKARSVTATPDDPTMLDESFETFEAATAEKMPYVHWQRECGL